MKVRYCAAVVFALHAGLAFGQGSDLLMLANPDPNTDRLIVRGSSAVYGSSNVNGQGTDVDFSEQDLALRVGAILNDTRELYLTLDSYHAHVGNSAFFDDTGASLPDNLYDVSVGVMYRQRVRDDWRVGGFLRVGSASNKPFDSFEELHLRGLGFLQIPHLEYTAWVVMLGVNTDLEIPVIPGLAYQFPISHHAVAIVGFPMLGAVGDIGDHISFNVVYSLVRNLNATMTFHVTERVHPYYGFRWRGRYFSRADRPDNRDRILLQDKRFFIGTRFDLSQRWTIDVQGGYLFDREFGEGNDGNERGNNNLRIGDTGFGQVGLGFSF